jgi:hypothetical protein
LEIDVKALQHPSASQKLAFMKQRTALLKRIYKFRELQRVYMPALQSFLSGRERQIVDGDGEQLPEATRLFMPSEIADATSRGRACAIGLAEVEARMCEGEAAEALELVRQGLRARTMTNRFRIKNYTGQGALTRGQGILRQINIKIHLAKVHYRYARAALLVLWGHGVWEEKLKVLKDEDVRVLNERAVMAEDDVREEQLDELARAIATPAGISAAAIVAAGEGSHTLSWIWYTVGATSENDNPKLHEGTWIICRELVFTDSVVALRVEWCKAHSRAKHFEEEVRHLREEMHRTMHFGVTASGKWDILASEVLEGSEPELMEGRQEYAAEQADREHRTDAFLKRKWMVILGKADEWLDGNTVGEGDAVTVELELGDELQPEDEEALLEGGLGD